MKKIFLFLFVFVLIAGICFFNPVLRQGFAEGEKKVILKGVIRGKGRQISWRVQTGWMFPAIMHML